MGRYSESLRSAVAACGALLISAHGLPSLVHALSFMVGSVAGYAVVGALAFGNLGDPGDGDVGRAPALWGNVHVLSIGGAILASYPASHFLPGYLAWPATGFAATYLVLLAAEFSIATRRAK